MAIETAQQFADTPEGWAERWHLEFEAARKTLEKWHEQGAKVERRYLDERDAEQAGESRLNLFHGDVETKKALLYGNPPRVRSRRRFADANDDEARVSAEMLERLLNSDLERDSDGFRTALAHARDDRLLPGLGAIRMRYVVEWGEPEPEQPAQMDEQGNELAPAVPSQPRKAHEDVETDYVHWRDLLWSPCRYWEEMRWVAFRAEMTRDAAVERFGDIGKLIPLNAAKKARQAEKKEDDPWSRAEVWEIWSKEDRRVYWYVEGFGKVLDQKDDPLGLENFWPCPRPLIANVTSSKFVPRPDFVLAQDAYDEIDNLTTRINLLEDALKVAGLYDRTQPGIERLIKSKGNMLIPVDNWAAFAEKGGIQGSVVWMPLDQIVNALNVLGEKRREKIILKDQVTGIGDIMRGAGTPGGATATEQRIKARATSARVQAAQDEFAAFATEAQKIRAEIIARMFDPQTIIERSNVMRTADANMAQRAAELLKSEFAQYRIEVAADTLAMTDFDALKQESTEYLTAVSGFLAQVQPIAAVSPPAVPYLLEMLKVGLAGFRRAATLEGILDKAITAATQAAQQPPAPPPPDPKLEAAKVKAQAEAGKAQASMQQTQLDGQVHMATAAMDLKAAQAKHRMEMQKMAAQTQQMALREVFSPAPGEEE